MHEAQQRTKRRPSNSIPFAEVFYVPIPTGRKESAPNIDSIVADRDGLHARSAAQSVSHNSRTDRIPTPPVPSCYLVRFDITCTKKPTAGVHIRANNRESAHLWIETPIGYAASHVGP